MEHEFEINYVILHSTTLKYLAPFDEWVTDIKNAIHFPTKNAMETFAFLKGINSYSRVVLFTRK